MIQSFIYDGGLNITNNVTNITGITSTYSVNTTDGFIYSTDAAPHVIIMPLAADAGLGKSYTLSPAAGWNYEIILQGSDQSNGDLGQNPIYTNNTPVTLVSNGVNLWILGGGSITD